MSKDELTKAAGDDIATLFAELRDELSALRESFGVGGYEPARVRRRFAEALGLVERLSDSVDASFDAVQEIADVMGAGQVAEDRRAVALAEQLESARESIAAVSAARDLAAAQYADALARRDRVIASMHEELAAVHAEVVALSAERTEQVAERERAERVAERARELDRLAKAERAVTSRDAVICEMHYAIADAHTEALTFERERDEARARLTALEDEARLQQMELEAVRAERDRYRDRLRDTLEAARTGQMAELSAGWLPLTGRLDRPGGRRVSRTTADQRRVMGPTRPVTRGGPERDEAPAP